MTPWTYSTPHGNARQMEIKVKLNGGEVGFSHVLIDVPAFESELEYYTRLAVQELQKQIRGKAE